MYSISWVTSLSFEGVYSYSIIGKRNFHVHLLLILNLTEFKSTIRVQITMMLKLRWFPIHANKDLPGHKMLSLKHSNSPSTISIFNVSHLYQTLKKSTPFQTLSDSSSWVPIPSLDLYIDCNFFLHELRWWRNLINYQGKYKFSLKCSHKTMHTSDWTL